MYQSIPKLPTPPSPTPPVRANPRAFDFFEKFWSNSLLCWQFRWSNAPPVRVSKSVKSPNQIFVFYDEDSGWWKLSKDILINLHSIIFSDDYNLSLL